MSLMMASADILSQKYTECPGPLGKEFSFEGGIFMWVLARATLAAGDLCAWKIGVNPNLFEVDDQTSASAELHRPAGFACAAATTGTYIAIQIGGCNTSLSLGLLTDGGVAAGDLCVPDGTDKQLDTAVVGTDGEIAIVRALADDSSTALLQYRIMNLR
jgi:hypothetical protein